MADQQKLDEEIIDIADSDIDNNKTKQRTIGMKCQVCGKPTENRHFGGIACRACGAFFKSLMDY
jgi:ribosomal protein L37AE/L43A